MPLSSLLRDGVSTAHEQGGVHGARVAWWCAGGAVGGEMEQERGCGGECPVMYPAAATTNTATTTITNTDTATSTSTQYDY